MNSKDLKVFFVHTLDELRQKCNTESNYNYVKASGILRQILIDENPLLDLINKEYRKKILFEVNKPAPPAPKQSIGADGTVWTDIGMGMSFMSPSKDKSRNEMLTKDQFLKRRVISFGHQDITVLEIIKLNANKIGGVHIDTKQPTNIKDLNILIGNSAMNIKGGITGGAFQINEISLIVLQAVNELEELVKIDIGLK
jgi:hypothetical protein